MRIKWANLIVMLLVAFVVVIVATIPRELAAFIATLDDLSSARSDAEIVRGLVGLGLICVTLVAITKIVCSMDRPE